MDSETTSYEMPEEDRLALKQLIDQIGQIGQIAMGLEKLTGPDKQVPPPVGGESIFRFKESDIGFWGAQKDRSKRLIASANPPLPDPRLVRRLIHRRRSREQFFDNSIFADPAWDMLLDLTAARAEHVRVSVTSLCIASGVPPSTALRWIGQLIEAGLFQRIEDDADRRRIFVELTDKAAVAISRYFASLAKGN